jgi:hypothetical protein
MSKNSSSPKAQSTTAVSLNDKAVRNLADAIYKHLQDEGCQVKDIINVSSQLLGLVTDQIRDNQPNQ